MELLIDTNVILDMVFKRNSYEASMNLFRKIRKSRDNALITATTVTDLYYIIRKETHDLEKTYQVMENILKLVGILSVTGSDIQEALGQKWKDFEDCVQYTTAKNSSINYIVTENRKDFEDNTIAVISPDECLKLFE